MSCYHNNTPNKYSEFPSEAASRVQNVLTARSIGLMFRAKAPFSTETQGKSLTVDSIKFNLMVQLHQAKTMYLPAGSEGNPNAFTEIIKLKFRFHIRFCSM